MSANLLTAADLDRVVIFPGMELQIKYAGIVRDCRIEEIQAGKGYIKVFDKTRNGYRTFTTKEIGK